MHHTMTEATDIPDAVKWFLHSSEVEAKAYVGRLTFIELGYCYGKCNGVKGMKGRTKMLLKEARRRGVKIEGSSP
jgi:hypothetical protein